MSRAWFYKVLEDQNNLVDFITYFYNEYEQAVKELNSEGYIEAVAKKLPIMMEKRYAQYQVINALMQHYDNLYDQKHSELYRKYTEHYNRELTSKDINNYILGDPEIISIRDIKIEIGLLREHFASITKGLDCKQYQIGHITKLRIAGLDNAIIGELN